MVSSVVKQGPAGSTSSAAPALMTEMMVSLPTTSSNSTTYYFRIVPTQTGRLLVDTRLSYLVDPEVDALPESVLSVESGVTAQAYYNYDEEGEEVNSYPLGNSKTTALLIDVTQGTPVLLSVRQWGTYVSGGYHYEVVNHVLRVSAYAVSRTGETPDLWWKTDQDERNGNTSSIDDLSWNRRQHREEERFDLALHAGKMGRWRMNRSVGGPAPNSLLPAVTCGWNHARQYAGNTFDQTWWGGYSPSPGDPPIAWNPGMQVCPVLPDSAVTPWDHGGGSGDRRVGITYRAYNDGFGVFDYNNAQWYVFQQEAYFGIKFHEKYVLNTVHIKWAEEEFGDLETGGLNGTGYVLEWDDNKPVGHLLELYLAMDEFTIENDSGADPNVQGWIAVNEIVGTTDPDAMHIYPEQNDGRMTQWPWPGFSNPSYWGGGLERVLAEETPNCDRWGDYRGGEMPWWKVPNTLMELALAVEEEALSLYPDEDEFSISGLGFRMIPNDTAGDALPADVVGPDLFDWLDGYTRDAVALCVMMLAEYPDWIITDNPAYPDATALGIGGGPTVSDRAFVGRS